MTELVNFILGLPKSLLLSFYYFPLKRAVGLPVVTGRRLKIGSLGRRDAVQIPKGSRLKIGINGSFALGGVSYWYIGKDGKLVLNGNASFGRGIQLICNGELELGKNFSMNAGCILNACKHIKIGDDFLAGWGIEIIDGDGHRVLSKDEHRKTPEVMYIGNHVWCAKHVTILKGAMIQDNSVCAANSVITMEFVEPNLLIGGTNKILKRNIDWDR